ncbi:MAG: hypothetical protein GWP91_02155 [Rhodobacterales bacterium]|nr:hypothetical protein [Rhodobacterales bacterium]
MTPGLTLPLLSDDWTYEGWVIDGDTTYSTGRFDLVDAPDAEGAVLQAGDEPVPEVPGQDFVGLGLALRGVERLVTVDSAGACYCGRGSWRC